MDDPLTAALAPPPDENAEDKTRRVRGEIKAKRISDQIDAALRVEKDDLKRRKEKRTTVKLLLLGQAGSGKSTLLKQFQLYYSPEVLEAERHAWRPVVYFNIVRAVRAILEALDAVGAFEDEPSAPAVPARSMSTSPVSSVGSSSSPRTRNTPAPATSTLSALRASLQPIVELDAPLAHQLLSGGGGGAVLASAPIVRPGWQQGRPQSRGRPAAAEASAARRISALKDDIDALWRHPLTQRLRKRGLRLEDSAAFFLESIQRIARPDYVTSLDDVLHVRLQTLGVSEYKFDVQILGRAVQLCLYDVGGARGHRKAWIPYFDTAHAVIFLAPISAFDQYLEEDRKKNRIDDSLQLFTEICTNKVLKDLHLVLFLNKTDVLRAKLAAGIKVNKYITSFGDRPNEYNEVSAYFRAHFLQVHRRSTESRRVLYEHFTSVIDTQATQTIIVNVSDSIMRGYFADAKLV